MFERILVPLDGSLLSERVLAAVRPLLGSGTVVTLLHVVPEYGTEPDAVDRVRSYLVDVQNRLKAEGVASEVAIRKGDAAEMILTQAASTEPSLIAMATHGRSGLSRLVRGSVAERVLRQAVQPLLLVNPFELEERLESSFRRLLVPLDGSETSTEILPLVEAVGRRAHSEVLLLYVAPTHPMDPYETEVVPYHLCFWEEEYRSFLNEQARRLRGAGLDVRTLLAAGPTSARILTAIAEETIDLLAMTTHGRSGLSRWVLGSVAENVLRHCTTPILLKRV